jgi:hypothetical protein
MLLPKGKEVLISTSGTAIQDNNSKNIMDDPDIADGLKLTLDEDVNLQLSTNYEPLYSGGGNLGLDVLGKISQEVTGIGGSSQFKQFGFQVWKGTQPVVFTINLSFYLGMANAFSGRTEVVNPMRKLINLTLPSEGGVAGSLVAPGPSLLELFGEGANVKTRTTSIRIGNILRFDRVVIKSVQPTFSKIPDSQGYPTSGKISMEVNTLYNATTSLFPLDNGQVNPFDDTGTFFT